MTTPAPPRKHLYTLPVVAVLPDPTTVPEGYPVLLEVGTGAAAKRSLFQRQGAAFVAAGGGGGGAVKFGEVLPATGPVKYHAVPGTDPDALLGGNGGVVPVISSSLSAVSLPKDSQGNPLTAAWRFRDATYGDQQDAVFDVRLPARVPDPAFLNDPGGQRAMRMDFRYRHPDNGRGYAVVAVAESYDPAFVSRVIGYWSEVDHHDAVALPSGQATGASYNGQQNEDPSDYTPLWGRQYNNTRGFEDFSITIPPGANGVQFYAYASSTYSKPAGVNDGTWDGLITDIRFTECDYVGIDPGTLFFETSTSSIWLFDNTVMYQKATDREIALGLAPGGTAGQPHPENVIGFGGAGWYRLTRPVLSMNRFLELDAVGMQSGVYHSGYHLFANLSDADSQPYGLGRYARIGHAMKAVFPAFGSLPFYEDRFIQEDDLVKTKLGAQGSQAGGPYRLDVITGATAHLTAPTINLNPAYAYGTSRGLPVSTSRWYRVAPVQKFGVGGVRHEGVPGAPVQGTTAATQFAGTASFAVSISAYQAGTTAFAVYASDTGAAAADYVHLGDVAADLDDYQTVTYQDSTTPVGGVIATPDITTDTTSSTFIVGCAYLDLSVAAHLLLDAGVADQDFQIEATSFAQGATGQSRLLFRYVDSNNYFFVAYNNSFGAQSVTVGNRLAGVDTVLVTQAIADKLYFGIEDFGGGGQVKGLHVTVTGIHVKIVGLSNFDPSNDTVLYDADILTTDHAAATLFGFKAGLASTALRRIVSLKATPTAQDKPWKGFPVSVLMDGGKSNRFPPLGDNPGISAYDYVYDRTPFFNTVVPLVISRLRIAGGVYSYRRVMTQYPNLSLVTVGLGGNANLFASAPAVPIVSYLDLIEVTAFVPSTYAEPAPFEMVGHLYFGSNY